MASSNRLEIWIPHWFLGLALLLASCLFLGSDANGMEKAQLKQAAEYFADRRDDAAESDLLRLSNARNSDADVFLGFLYSDPLSPLWKPDKALLHFRKAAEAGNPEGAFQLAESHFWHTYRVFAQTGNPSPVGVTEEESSTLLRQAVAKQHMGARLRLAIQCLIAGWPCTESELEGAYSLPAGILGTPRMAASVFGALRALREDDQQSFRGGLVIGIESADPLTAALIANSLLRDVDSPDDCPERDSQFSTFQAISEANGVENIAPKWSERRLSECYDPETVGQIQEEAATWLATRVTGGAHASWCSVNASENSAKCIITSLWDEVFSCTRVTMPKFFYLRGGKYIDGTKRYRHCRETLAR